MSGDKILCSLPATLRRVILFREHDHETFLLVIRKTKFHMSQMRTRLQKRKIGDYKISNFWQTLVFVVVRTGELKQNDVFASHV